MTNSWFGAAELQNVLDPKGKKALEDLCAAGCDAERLTGLLCLIATTQSESMKHLTDGRTIQDLRDIAKRARKLHREIEKLRKTRLVQLLWEEKNFRRGDLLAGNLRFHTSEHRFAGLIALPELAKERFSRRSPELTSLRIKLAQYIRSTTGDWHDDLRAQILACIIPNHSNRPISAKGEYQWRKRHCNGV